MCKQLQPRVVMAFLNDLFRRFDRRLDEFGVYKVRVCHVRPVIGAWVQQGAVVQVCCSNAAPMMRTSKM